MATQSPGIYFNEVDNTQFENPKAITGTTIAIVGYAKKGPINTPIQIGDWSSFVNTFGKPIDGYYSGLAVKNVLASGGSVLFTRVADSTASPSNCIVKNAIEAVNGSISFSRGTDIMVGSKNYVNGKIYTLKLVDKDGNSKVFFVRSPANGKLTQASILTQISKQLGNTHGTYEAKINSNIPAGFYGFDFNIDGVNRVDDESFRGFYIETIANESKTTLVENIIKAISTGTNARVALSVSASATGAVYLNENTILEGLVGTKTFTVIKNGVTKTISISVNKPTLKTLAGILDNKLASALNVRCFLEPGNNEDENNIVLPKLIFVRKDKDASYTLDIGSKYSDKEASIVEFNQDSQEYEIVGSEDLFSWVKTSVEELQNNSSIIEADKCAEFVLPVCGYEVINNGTNALNGFKISYDEDIGSIIFESNATGETSKFELIDSLYGVSLIDNLLNPFGSVNGQSEIEMNVYRDAKSKKIKFESVNSLETPVLANAGSADIGLEDISKYGDLLDIEKDPTDYNSVGYDEPVVGLDAVDASARDMVVFTTRENGSATNNITVEVYTKNRPDGTYVRGLIVKNGLNRTEYEDISLNYDDVDNRFDTIINETVENGGNPYITVTVVKNDFTNPEVELPDGVYTIGKANSAGAIAKDEDVDYTAYNFYDYAVGTDGIPADNGYTLFEDVMRAGTSVLANKDLYDFHVIITPDDISEEVQNAAIALCEDRGDAVAIIDPPIGLDKKGVIDWHNGRGYGRGTLLQSNYAMTYWPWCKVFDNSTGSGKYTWIMPSVVMAAKYTAIDSASGGAGCWYAPAGETNGVLPVIDIEQYPNKLDRDELYVDYNRVNPITKFKDGSIVVYGEKTLQRINSVLTKIHTRRMLVQIKKQCREALRGYIFMPNTTDYLGKISSNVTAILETYKAGGGLNWYKVVCDETNNPTEIRQQDIVNVDVVLVPEGTIEQINIGLTLNKTAETVSDSE